MKINFTKMHGLGNDFIIIDGVNQRIKLEKKTIVQWADRHKGIGFDQCLLIEKSLDKDIDFYYRIFNVDGNEVGQCGNGARCLARFVQHYNLSPKLDLCIATKTTRMNLHINPDKTVRVDFGLPSLEPRDIPLIAPQAAVRYALELSLGKRHFVHAISLGNPHAISVVDNIQDLEIDILGREISIHPLFPEQANAGFMQIINPHQIALRVYERGCGETLACGSGAVAAAAVGRLFYNLEPCIRVDLPGGSLQVDWPDLTQPVQLTGPASFVYEGHAFSE